MDSDKEKLWKLLQQQYDYYLYNLIEAYYTDNGMTFKGQFFPARHLYKQYMQFFAAGKYHQERAVFSGNRVGKTTSLCGYELVKHTTRKYPAWWPGKIIQKPTTWLVAGKTSQTTRDVIQTPLFGSKKSRGTGLFPKSSILDLSSASGGVSGAIDTAYIKCEGFPDDEPSIILFRAYGQESDSIEGLTLDGFWVDEESPLNFYTEALTRLFTTKGMGMWSFTPLKGHTEGVQYILGEDGEMPQYKPELYLEDIRKAVEYAHG